MNSGRRKSVSKDSVNTVWIQSVGNLYDYEFRSCVLGQGEFNLCVINQYEFNQF